LYLIGGAARTGKSTLATRLVKKVAMPYIPIDAVRQGLVHGLDDYEWDERRTKRQLAAQFAPIMKSIASNLGHCWPNGVIESDILLPRYISEIERKLPEPVACCFLGWSDVDRETIVKYEGLNRWFGVATPIEQERYRDAILRFSALVDRECLHLGLPYIDMAEGRYRDQLALALESLLEQGRMQ
jgi:hypothetical protein